MFLVNMAGRGVHTKQQSDVTMAPKQWFEKSSLQEGMCEEYVQDRYKVMAINIYSRSVRLPSVILR